MVIVWDLMVLAFSLFAIVNGAYMLFSPRAWFELPDWLAPKGSATLERDGSGWRATQLRVVGAALIAFASCMLYSLIRLPK